MDSSDAESYVVKIFKYLPTPNTS